MFTSLIRQNGILVIVLVMVILCIHTKKKEVIFTCCVACLVFFELMKRSTYKYVWNVELAPQLKYLAMTNDISYLYYEDNNISDEGMEPLIFYYL